MVEGGRRGGGGEEAYGVPPPPPPPSGIDSRSFNFVFANGLSRYYAVARGSGEARTLEFLMNLVICSAIYIAGACLCVRDKYRGVEPLRVLIPRLKFL